MAEVFGYHFMAVFSLLCGSHGWQRQHGQRKQLVALVDTYFDCSSESTTHICTQEADLVSLRVCDALCKRKGPCGLFCCTASDSAFIERLNLALSVDCLSDK
jgi:hypothetical protein